MWPWGHAAVGYLAYRAWVARTGRGVDGAAVLALGLGTQGPDLIDKPLGWYTAVLPAGRSLAHSVLFAMLVTAVATSAARRFDRPVVAGAFALGYWLHLVGDAYASALRGEFSNLTYLAYPFVSLPGEPSSIGLLYLLRHLELTSFLAAELALTAVALALWVRDGWPGLDVLWSRLSVPRDDRQG